MNDKAKLDDFEAPGQETVEISIRDKSKSYIILEASGEDFNELFAPLNNTTDPTKKAKAAKELPAKLIAKCVWHEDGSSITFEQASGFRHALQKKLQEAVMKFNGLTNDADDAAKNA